MTMIEGAMPGGSVHMTRDPAWISAASYWQPAHVVTSAWLEHAPFAFWLIDAIRPRSVVELGAHHGFSCFVFAEAIKRLGLEADVHALDTWAGDDQAGYYGEDVYASVRAIVEADYPGTVHLMRGWFADSRPAIGDGTVDLLHIDGRHGYEDVREDFEQWLPVVRDGGIVLFHDIEERDRGFGVWRLWQELAATRPSFAFTHGHGLGLIAVGAAAERTRPGAPRGGSRDEGAGARALRGARQGRLAPGGAARDARGGRIAARPRRLAQRRPSTQRDEIRQQEQVIADYRQSTSWRITRPVRAIGSAAAPRRLTTRAGGVHGRLASRADPRIEHPRQLRDHASAVPRRSRRVPRVVPVRRAGGGRRACRSTSHRATSSVSGEAWCAASTSPTSRRARPSTSPRTDGAVLDFVHRHAGRLPDVRRVGRGAARRRRPACDLHRRGPRPRLRGAHG